MPKFESLIALPTYTCILFLQSDLSLKTSRTPFLDIIVLAHIYIFHVTRPERAICNYIDEVVTYTGCESHHRVTTRRFFNRCLARGISMHCSSPEPSSTAVMRSTRKRGTCSVCIGARSEIEEVTLFLFSGVNIRAEEYI